MSEADVEMHDVTMTMVERRVNGREAGDTSARRAMRPTPSSCAATPTQA